MAKHQLVALAPGPVRPKAGALGAKAMQMQEII